MTSRTTASCSRRTLSVKLFIKEILFGTGSVIVDVKVPLLTSVPKDRNAARLCVDSRQGEDRMQRPRSSGDSFLD